MTEIDPVIFEFKARVDGYLASLRATTTRVDDLVGRQEARVRQLEAEMKRSSGAIAGHLKGLAAAFGAAFSVREMTGLLDSFTRLQNNLRVAGVEGAALKDVQDRLFESAQRYGTSLEGLSGLYSGLSQISKDLGASQQDLFLLTDATSQALKITGISAEQAGGAMLGLKQVLGAARIGTDDFNQVVEGGLLPLVQAAANSEKFGGSVNKLKNYIKDTGLSGREFFDLFRQGAAELEGKAAKAALTLSGGMTALGNAMTVYFGEADKANGVSAALGIALGSLAKNLDTLIPAIASIAVGLGARYVAGAVAASAATGALSVATFALQARMAGAATSTEALSFALNGLRLNPVMLAATALGAGLAYVAFQSAKAAAASETLSASIDQQAQALGNVKARQDQVAAETGNLTKEQKDAITSTAKLTGEANLLATAWGRVAAQAKNAALEQARATLKKAEDNYSSADQAYQDKAKYGSMVRSGYRPIGRKPDGTPIYTAGAQDAINRGEQIAGRSAAPQLQIRDRASENLRLARAEEARIASQPLADFKQAPASAISTKGGNKGKGGGSAGPSSEELAARFNDELAGYMSQTNSAMASIAASAEQQAEYELRNVELSRIRTIDGIKADKDYSDARKQQLIAQVETLAEAERERIAFGLRAQREQEAADKAQAEFDVQRDSLQAQYNLAESQDVRRRIALQMVEAEAKHLKAVQEAIIASTAATEAEKTRARIILASIDGAMAAQKEQVNRSNEGPLARWRRQNGEYDPATGTGYDTQARAEEAVVSELERVRDGIHGALSKAIGTDDPLVSYLLDTLLQELLFKPIAAALSQGGGGGDGIGAAIASIGSAIFGRASGGRVNPGQTYRINEAASPGNPEFFRPDVGGQIIPLGRTNAVQAGGPQAGGTVRIVIEEAPGFASRVQTEATGVAIEVYKATLPGTIDAAANETMRRASRPRI